jgi:hypothetical protein
MKPASLAFAIVAGFAAASAGYFALIPSRPAINVADNPSTEQSVWLEVKWPFAMDQWGTGRAFVCKAADCGTEVTLYLRAKLGSCNCSTGVADDGDLDRMSDFDLIGAQASPVGAGRPIAVGWMQGRSRAYALSSGSGPGKSAISVVFNDRCDMISATAVHPHDRAAAIEPGVLQFLNSGPILHWAEIALGI